MLQAGGRLRDGEGRAQHHLHADGSAVGPDVLVRSSELLGGSSYLRAWQLRENPSHHLTENHSLPLAVPQTKSTEGEKSSGDNQFFTCN